MIDRFLGRWDAAKQMLMLCLMVLAILGFLGRQLIQAAPVVEYLQALQIKLSEQNVVLGHLALGQAAGANSAAREHLHLIKDEQLDWSLQNIADKKRVDVKTSRIKERYIRRWALQTGDKLVFPSFSLTVMQADQDNLQLMDEQTQQKALWTGTELLLDGKKGYKACEHLFWILRPIKPWQDWLRWQLRADQKSLFLFSLGGHVHCSKRWLHADLAMDSLRFYWHHGRFWIGSGSQPTRLKIERDGKQQSLQHLLLPLTGEEGRISRLIMGRTHYKVSFEAPHLTLQPVYNQQVFRKQVATEQASRHANRPVKTRRQQLQALEKQGVFAVFSELPWIGDIVQAEPLRGTSLAALLVMLCTGTILGWQLSAANREMGAANTLLKDYLPLVSALFFAWATIAWNGVLSVTLPLLWLSACSCTLCLAGHQRLTAYAGLLWLLFLLLAGMGVLTLTQLAAGSNNSRWLHFAADYVTLLVLFLVLMQILCIWPLFRLAEYWQYFCNKQWCSVYSRFFSFTFSLGPKILLIVLVAGLISLQVVAGSEIGVAGFQPVELVKLTVVFIMAFLLWDLRMLRVIYSQQYQQKFHYWIIMFCLGGFFFLLLSGIVFIGVSDYSPIVIVLTLLAVFIWLVIPHPVRQQPFLNWILRGLLIGLPVCMVIFTGYYLFNNPPDYNSLIPQSERLRIWANPTLYPEAASQLLISLAKISSGGWLGRGWFGENGSVMYLPAVQDDFVAAFLLNKMGGLLGLFLLLVQCAWVSHFFMLSKQLTAQRCDTDRLKLLTILAYVLMGLTWLHLIHWLISWGNVLGLLPIMGQPMTWLSSGRSHLLAIAFPTVTLGMFAAWILAELQENEVNDE